MSEKRLTVAEAQRLREEVVAACPDLDKVDVVALVRAVIDGSGENLRALEGVIEGAGAIGPEVAAGFMAVGAMHEVVLGMPEGDDRRKLLEAGRAVGRFMAEQYRRRIAEALSEREGRN